MNTSVELGLWSGKNYLKRDSSSGSASASAPTTSAFGGTVYISRYTVTHNLGYIPLYRVYYEPFGDGVIYGQLGSRNPGYVVDPRNSAVDGPYCISWTDTTTLTIEIGNTVSGGSTIPIYWVIYKDYSL